MTMTDSDPHRAEKILLIECLPVIRQTYDKAQLAGYKDPIVLLFNLSEPQSYELAVASLGKDRFRDFEARRDGGMEFSAYTIAVGLNCEDAIRWLEKLPEPTGVADSLRKPMDGTTRIRCVVFNGGRRAVFDGPRDDTGPSP
jgi:hypothetical protein